MRVFAAFAFVRRVSFVSFAALAASTSVSLSAHAARPSFCSEQQPDRHRGQVGTVLITTASAEDAVAIDDASLGKGPVLVLNVEPGKHKVTITPVKGGGLTRAFELRAGQLEVVGLPGTALTRPHAPLLSRTALGYFDECDGMLTGQRAQPGRQMQAAELARLRCDPRLAPLLPTTAAMQARFEAACRSGVGAACRDAGDQWSDSVGHRDPDLDQAKAWYRRGCTLGDAAACGALAELLDGTDVGPVGHAEAASLRERACDGGDLVSCERIGYSLLPPRASVADRERGVRYLVRACEGGGYSPCESARRVQLQLACQKGDHGACELLDPTDSVRVAAESSVAAASSVAP
jgi:hypothetical protein